MAGSQDLLPSPKRGRVFSFSSKSSKSDKSHKSAGSVHKISLIETHDEKVARVLHTKADPTLAMNEAQPATVALEKSNLGSLRAMQHKDQYGNIITVPDLSNPTRYRFERPLETIRSFEAAIDGSYNSRQISYAPTESRRTSYFGGNNRDQGHGYYNGRGNSSRPDSLVDNHGGGGPNPPTYNPHPTSNSHGGRPRQRYNDRMHPDSMIHTQNFYPQQSYQRSNDNITAASGSGSNGTDQWANHTDPSSVNSSLDRLQQQQQQQHQQQPPHQQQQQQLQQHPHQHQHQQKPERNLAEAYGFNGFGPDPQLDSTLPPIPPPHGKEAGVYDQNGYDTYEQMAPTLPPKDGRKASRAVGTTPAPTATAANGRKSIVQTTPSISEKRTSWFKRRFSKG
ncbi:DUF2406 domain containing protein [Elaphomyces granulatus]